jgi:hypothetical protein
MRIQLASLRFVLGLFAFQFYLTSAGSKKWHSSVIESVKRLINWQAAALMFYEQRHNSLHKPHVCYDYDLYSLAFHFTRCCVSINKDTQGGSI